MNKKVTTLLNFLIFISLFSVNFSGCKNNIFEKPLNQNIEKENSSAQNELSTVYISLGNTNSTNSDARTITPYTINTETIGNISDWTFNFINENNEVTTFENPETNAFTIRSGTYTILATKTINEGSIETKLSGKVKDYTISGNKINKVVIGVSLAKEGTCPEFNYTIALDTKVPYCVAYLTPVNGGNKIQLKADVSEEKTNESGTNYFEYYLSSLYIKSGYYLLSFIYKLENSDETYSLILEDNLIELTDDRILEGSTTATLYFPKPKSGLYLDTEHDYFLYFDGNNTIIKGRGLWMGDNENRTAFLKSKNCSEAEELNSDDLTIYETLPDNAVFAPDYKGEYKYKGNMLKNGKGKDLEYFSVTYDYTNDTFTGTTVAGTENITLSKYKGKMNYANYDPYNSSASVNSSVSYFTICDEDSETEGSGALFSDIQDAVERMNNNGKDNILFINKDIIADSSTTGTGINSSSLVQFTKTFYLSGKKNAEETYKINTNEPGLRVFDANLDYGKTGYVSNIDLIGGNLEDSYTYGGVLLVDGSNSSKFHIYSGTSISGGMAENGGGIAFNSNYMSEITISGNVNIMDNSATKNGGGLYFETSWANITIGPKVTIGKSGSANQADCGGGIYISNGNLVMKNSTISYNYANTGAGLYLYNSNTYNIIESKIDNNTANSGGEGAAIYIWNGDLTLTNTSVSNNTITSGSNNAAIYNQESKLTINSGSIIQNNDCGGIYFKEGSLGGSVLITDGLFNNNTNESNIGKDIYIEPLAFTPENSISINDIIKPAAGKQIKDILKDYNSLDEDKSFKINFVKEVSIYLDYAEGLKYDLGKLTKNNITQPYVLKITDLNPNFATLKEVLNSNTNIYLKLDLSDCSSLTTLSDGAFADFTTLVDVILPAYLEIIGKNLFTNTPINKVTFTSVAPEATFSDGESMFTGFEYVDVYIPADFEDNYRSLFEEDISEDRIFLNTY